MKKILTVIGARPQIIKAAAISRAIAADFSDRLTEVLVHTGQHYDHGMSRVFFNELGIPDPKYHLNIKQATSTQQIAQMLPGLEEIFIQEKPDLILVYGDTNSTLAAALTSSKLGMPLAHIEAGLRSFNKSMPEEINRIVTDHSSSLLFVPTKAAIRNLEAEGLISEPERSCSIDHPCIVYCGDVMYDNALHFREIARTRSSILQKMELKENEYLLATIHRDHNTDHPERLSSLLNAFCELSESMQLRLILPIHPRTSKMFSDARLSELQQRIKSSRFVKLIDPVSYLDMINLESNAKLILTDSGGVQKEAFFFHKPCIILRPQTEWVELVENGNAILADVDGDRILKAYDDLTMRHNYTWPEFYGDGNAAEFICNQILEIA